MIKINIVCVGNLKEKFWADACQEYSKRLSRFCRLNIVELDEQNSLDKKKCLEKEGQEIKACLRGKCVLLAIEGKERTSLEFAEFLDAAAIENSELTFVIGSSYGVSEEIKSLIGEKLSFGKATFPHNLARVMLLEQIYRAFMINSGAAYHK